MAEFVRFYESEAGGPVKFSGRPTPRRSRKKRVLWIAAACLALMLLWLLYIQVRISQVDDLASGGKTDVGIVLGASLWSNKPSPALKERLEAAIAGYQAGDYPMLIVSGGLDNDRMKLTEAEGMAEYLEERGVPKSDILLENEATSTYENLLLSQRIMQERGMKTATIVTHRFHGSRSADIAEFLRYDHPQYRLASTEVLTLWQRSGRETLAFTKWLLDKARLPAAE
ncbi:YdcF family protein [Saccharibacillus sp. CPCC 101409]|uniref:YdcF family protein n=1 Tax=Saccharibacillus sp. CPCC 101409 TaxID=3058041 RepID=UPI002670E1BE|nr:YdcF family protein [Saccharibacillus sp. CPCC 101409]MDO3412820.1 YdcF family protein [Saccharibacillus sp. CPCC 101409]